MSEKNNNQKVVTEEVKTEGTVENQQPGQVTQQVVVVEQKNGFGTWLKQHWKGVVGGILGAVGIGGSAVVAYKKGKAAGINSIPVQNNEDYSLNPNE